MSIALNNFIRGALVSHAAIHQSLFCQNELHTCCHSGLAGALANLSVVFLINNLLIGPCFFLALRFTIVSLGILSNLYVCVFVCVSVSTYLSMYLKCMYVYMYICMYECLCMNAYWATA